MVEEAVVAVGGGLVYRFDLDILVHEFSSRGEEERDPSEHVRRESEDASGSVQCEHESSPSIGDFGLDLSPFQRPARDRSGNYGSSVLIICCFYLTSTD